LWLLTSYLAARYATFLPFWLLAGLLAASFLAGVWLFNMVLAGKWPTCVM
jgi:hypothetical protein